MSRTPYMPFWVSDFLGDTTDLDTTEVGALVLLLCAQWNRRGASLPDDPILLGRITRCGRNWPKVWHNLQRFFERDGAGIYSARGRREVQTVEAKREANSRNGKLGGTAKALKSLDVAQANAKEALERKAAKPEPDIHKEEEQQTLSEPEGFQEFWEAVPKKVSKATAQKEYVKALNLTDAATLIAAIRRYSQSRLGQEPKYTMHPTNWLKSRRWTDDYGLMKSLTKAGEQIERFDASRERFNAFCAGA